MAESNGYKHIRLDLYNSGEQDPYAQIHLYTEGKRLKWEFGGVPAKMDVLDRASGWVMIDSFKRDPSEQREMSLFSDQDKRWFARLRCEVISDDGKGDLLPPSMSEGTGFYENVADPAFVLDSSTVAKEFEWKVTARYITQYRPTVGTIHKKGASTKRSRRPPPKPSGPEDFEPEPLVPSSGGKY